MNIKSVVAGGFALLACGYSASAHAAYDATKGGWTEVINCTLFRNQWGNGRWTTNYGTKGVSEYTITPNGWWTYAHLGSADTDCDAWTDGELVGGATFVNGRASSAQGVTVNIFTYWADGANPANFRTQSLCGHQHAVTYVWGWRYFGSSWGFEFVKAHMLSTYWNTNDQSCEFQGAGNPVFPPPYDGFAFGPDPITIANSPYVVLYTKTQAISHYNAGCGQFECFHPVEALAQYCSNGVCSGIPY